MQTLSNFVQLSYRRIAALKYRKINNKKNSEQKETQNIETVAIPITRMELKSINSFTKYLRLPDELKVLL